MPARDRIEPTPDHPSRQGSRHHPRPETAVERGRAGAPANRVGDSGLGHLTPNAILRLQRTAGNQVVGRFLAQGTDPVIRRDVVDDAAKELSAPLQPSTVRAVRTFKKNAKKTSKTTWVTVLGKVAAEEPYWTKIRSHVMEGENTSPPAGLHSTAKASTAKAEPIGPRSPVTAGPSVIYKQWTRKRGDPTFSKLKISSFFPDNWSEEKIAAAVLLRNAGAEHQVEAPFGLTSNDGTTYPTTKANDPVKPTA